MLRSNGAPLKTQRKELVAATDPMIATPDWEDAAATVTVVDLEEFEAAHDDPKWRAFCERADQYVEAVERELVPRI